jgi:hypothetical protein
MFHILDNFRVSTVCFFPEYKTEIESNINNSLLFKYYLSIPTS